MSTAWAYWTQDIARRLSEQLGAIVTPEELVVPPNLQMGDMAFGCFRLGKERKQNPAELAKDIAARFSRTTTELTGVEAIGPYVNFTLRISDAVSRIVADVERDKDAYGNGEEGASRQLLLEYAQPNTHKEVHVGHLRNLALGVSLVRILRANGWVVIPASYHGDVGAHVAKCLWFLLRAHSLSADTLTMQAVDTLLATIPLAEKTGEYLGKLYTASTNALEEDIDAKERISELQRRLEAHDPILEKLWRETCRWSFEEMDVIFDDLGVSIERRYLESEVVDRGQAMVNDLLAKHIAKESQGAIVVDLEDKKLGIFLVRKSDGTSLYATKDLALAELKAKEYPDAQRSLMLVDNRQAYFQQLFETLRRMQFEQTFEFVGFDFVTLKSGAMSSREGNVVTYQSFRASVMSYAREEIMNRHADWSEGKVSHVAWAIAQGGMKFGMLKQDSDKVFTFDLEQALSFDGDTGPYCQYAATRLSSILKKVESVSTAVSASMVFDHPSEKALALTIGVLPARMHQAGKELRPCMIAQWCVEMAQRVHAFYRDVPVLDASPDVRAGRIRLVRAAHAALEKGLWLLGIPLPDEM